MATRRELEIALERAQKAGDDDFARQLARQLGGYGLPPLPTTEEVVGEFGRSASRGLADVAALPFDASRGIMNLVPGVDIPAEAGVAGAIRGLVPPQTEDPELAGAQRAGELVGGSLPFLAAPYAGLTRGATQRIAQEAATRQLVRGAGGQAPYQSMVGGIREAAALSPRAFSSAESSSIGAAATFGGAVSQADPESEIKPLIAEVIAGSVHPLSLAIRFGFNPAGAALKRGFQSMTPEGRQAAGGELLRQRLIEMGEDPAAVERVLRDTPREFGETTAVLSESPAMLAIERALMRDPRANNALRDQYRESWAQMNEAVNSLVREGSPEALRMAANLRRQQFDGIVTARIAEAERKAAQATEAMAPRATATSADVDVRARELMEEALKDARASENQLWGQIDKDFGIRPSNLIGRFDEIVQDLPPELVSEKIPASIRRFVRRAERGPQVERPTTGRIPLRRAPEPEPGAAPEIKAGELLSFRSEMLDAQRSARANGNFKDARRFGELADAVLADLEEIPGNAASTARTFSRVLNERFTSGPVGRLLRMDSTGSARVPEEMTLQATVGRGGTRGALDVQAQQEAVTPIRIEGFSMPETARLTELADTQEQFIREMVDKTLTPEGTVNPARLDKWRRDNRALLEQFPEMDRLTQSASDTQRFASAALARGQARMKAADKGAFAQLAGTEDTAGVFRRAMQGSEPQADMRALFRVVRSGDEAAKRGARSAFLESALQQTARNDGSIDGQAFRAIIDQYGDDLVASGAMTRPERARLAKVANAAARTDAALQDPRKLDELFENPSALEDLVISMVGAKAGQAIAGQGIGSSLVLAGRGASLLRNKLRNAPIATMQEIMLKAAQEPDFAADLLRRPATKQEAARINRHINAYLFGSALASEPEGMVEE